MATRTRRFGASLLLLTVAGLVLEGTPAVGENLAYPTTVTLAAYNDDPAQDDRFSGTLYTDYNDCRIYREVSVYRVRQVRRNGRRVRRDVLIGSALASNNISPPSTWSIPREDAPDGKYYAKSPERVLFRGEISGTAHHHVCAADVSPVISVNDDPAK